MVRDFTLPGGSGSPEPGMTEGETGPALVAGGTDVKEVQWRVTLVAIGR
jgi:hypothetical protein